MDAFFTSDRDALGDGGLEVGWRRAVTPLVARLRRYERARQKLEKKGGKVRDLSGLEEILAEPFGLLSKHGPISLADPKAIRAALLAAVGPDFVFDVRRLESGLATHALVRVRRDYYGGQGFVVEELHRGASHAPPDARFARLTSLGREREWLDLGAHREAARKIARGRGRAREASTDRVLVTVGTHVLSAAWHPDQRIGALVAKHLGAPTFQHAIELAYLALTAEPCELRSAATPEVRAFFESAYVQPAIVAYLDWLVRADGRALEGLPRRSHAAYGRLGGAFDRFLATRTTRWGRIAAAPPLAPIVLANWSRLGLVAEALLDDPMVCAAVRTLEADSRSIVAELVS